MCITVCSEGNLHFWCFETQAVTTAVFIIIYYAFCMLYFPFRCIYTICLTSNTTFNPSVVCHRWHILLQGFNRISGGNFHLSSLLTHFIHTILVTCHLMCQRHASVQVRCLALWTQRPLDAFLYRRGRAGDPGCETDPEINWTRVELQAAERFHKYLTPSCGHL